jgi:hypothetical protein
LRKILLAVALFAFASGVKAGNDALSQASPAPLGERVANYLQSMMTIKEAIWDQYHPSDMDYREEIHLAVSYEPAEKLIGVSVIGGQDDVKYVQALLERVRKTMLSFSRKIKSDYGIELTEADFSLAYLDVKTGNIILRMKGLEDVNASPTTTPGSEPTLTPDASPAKTP